MPYKCPNCDHDQFLLSGTLEVTVQVDEDGDYDGVSLAEPKDIGRFKATVDAPVLCEMCSTPAVWEPGKGDIEYVEEDRPEDHEEDYKYERP